MNLIDIKKAIVNKLKTNIPEVHVVAKEVDEGFQKASFFVQLIPVKDRLENQRLFTRSILVNILYFSKDRTDIENMKMIDRLRPCFWPYLEVLDRKITIPEVDAQINEDILEFSFTLRFIDEIEITDTHDLMGELNLKTK